MRCKLSRYEWQVILKSVREKITLVFCRDLPLAWIAGVKHEWLGWEKSSRSFDKKDRVLFVEAW